MEALNRARALVESAPLRAAPDLGQAPPMTSPRHVDYIVCGNAGAGKSTFAARLCAEQAAVLIDIDTVTERLAKLVLRGHGLPEDDRDSPEYKALLREPIYEALFDVALVNLPHLPCVIVGPFTRDVLVHSVTACGIGALLGAAVLAVGVWRSSRTSRATLSED